MTDIKEVLKQAQEDGFEFPYSEKQFLIAAASKNCGAHSHTFGVLVAKYRQQIDLANAYAYVLSTWEKCLSDFASMDFPTWNDLYDVG